jgi:hypothetical protein
VKGAITQNIQKIFLYVPIVHVTVNQKTPAKLFLTITMLKRQKFVPNIKVLRNLYKPITKGTLMNNEHEITVKLLEEAGYHAAMYGISLNKDQPLRNMPKVSEKLAFADFGHNKFLEQIMIWMSVRAPRYWWQEADTFRLSSKSSQSTMHTILENTLTKGNFECQDIQGIDLDYLNTLLTTKQLVHLKRKLPEGFMQTRMWMMSYKTLRNVIIQRRYHLLPHWPCWIGSILEQVNHPELLPKLKE